MLLAHPHSYKVTGWTWKAIPSSVSLSGHAKIRIDCEVALLRIDKSPPSQTLRHPNAEEMDDYRAYKLMLRDYRDTIKAAEASEREKGASEENIHRKNVNQFLGIASAAATSTAAPSLASTSTNPVARGKVPQSARPAHKRSWSEHSRPTAGAAGDGRSELALPCPRGPGRIPTPTTPIPSPALEWTGSSGRGESRAGARDGGLGRGPTRAETAESQTQPKQQPAHLTATLTGTAWKYVATRTPVAPLNSAMPPLQKTLTLSWGDEATNSLWLTKGGGG